VGHNCRLRDVEGLEGLGGRQGGEARVPHLLLRQEPVQGFDVQRRDQRMDRLRRSVAGQDTYKRAFTK